MMLLFISFLFFFASTIVNGLSSEKKDELLQNNLQLILIIDNACKVTFYQHNLLFSRGHRGGQLTPFVLTFQGQMAEIKLEVDGKATALHKNIKSR